MKVVVIGGTGHIGTYLIPRLVAQGHEVIVLSRGSRSPYQPHAAWNRVKLTTVDRTEAEERGEFADVVAAEDPEVVIDLMCFSQQSAKLLVDRLAGRLEHYLACGTIWVHGPSEVTPTVEEHPKNPFGDYGINKAHMEAYLLSVARRSGFPATVIHPGHIVGPGWPPLNPEGHFEPKVWSDIQAGRPVRIPNLGLETVHHVHADDVAQLFMLALNNWSAAVGESFHAVSPQALTLRGFAQAAYGWFGQEPNMEFVPWEELKQSVSEQNARYIWDHIAHSPCCSIAKAQRNLSYVPRYTSLQAVYESVKHLPA
ncbi:MAG: NAD-dependent epimerase/dehydratase family protein [Spirochaetota bacterium]